MLLIKVVSHEKTRYYTVYIYKYFEKSENTEIQQLPRDLHPCVFSQTPIIRRN